MRKLLVKKKEAITYYLSLVLTMVVMALVSYWIIGQTMYNKVVEQQYQELTNETENLNRQIEELSGKVDRLYYFTDSIWLMGNDHMEGSDYTRLMEYRRFLNMTFLEEEWIENYYLFFPKSGVVFDKTRIYLSWDEVYGVFSAIEGMDQEQFLKEVVWEEEGFLPSCTYNHDGKTDVVVPYIKRLAGVEDSIVVMMLDADQLLDLPGINASYDLSDRHQVFYDSGMSEALQQKYRAYKPDDVAANLFGNNVLLEIDPKGSSIKVRVMLQGDLIHEVMRSVLLGIFVVFAIMALTGIGILLGADWIFNRPYRGMSKKYEEREGTVRRHYTRCLLEAVSMEKELERAGEFFGINENKKVFVCIVRNPQKEDVQGQLEELRNEIQNVCPQSVCMSRRVWESVFVFYNQAETENLIQMIEKRMKREENLILAIGNVYENLRGISVSYMEARTVLEYEMAYPCSGCQRYNQLPSVAAMVTLGIETKNKLQVLISSKETEKAAALFCSVFEETCQNEYTINPVAANNFIAQIVGVLINSVEKLIPETEEREELLLDVSRLFNFESSSDFKDGVVKLIEKIGKMVPEPGKDDQAEIQKMLSYIDNHFDDSNLSLSMISEIFRMNAGYFSQYFKQHTNKNFSQYLEGIRIARSMELLAETDKTVSEIMELVGYSNRNTFYKAFLRVNGVSPTVYRESVMRKKD